MRFTIVVARDAGESEHADHPGEPQDPEPDGSGRRPHRLDGASTSAFAEYRALLAPQVSPDGDWFLTGETGQRRAGDLRRPRPLTATRS